MDYLFNNLDKFLDADCLWFTERSSLKEETETTNGKNLNKGDATPPLKNSEHPEKFKENAKSKKKKRVA